MSRLHKSLLIFLFPNLLNAQNVNVKGLAEPELSMHFPAIYFKAGSAEYAPMPYTADSCYSFIALHFDKSINDLVIWRDSAEGILVSKERIKKINAALKQKIKNFNATISDMGDQQKISPYHIRQSRTPQETVYLHTLNRVFEVSKTKVNKQLRYSNHVMSPRIGCWNCWKHGFHLQTYLKLRKMQKRREKGGNAQQ